MNNDNSSKRVAGEVDRRSAIDDDSDVQVEPLLEGLTENLSTSEHTRSRKVLVSLVSDWAIGAVLLSSILVILQALTRLWATATYGWEVGLYPVADQVFPPGGSVNARPAVMLIVGSVAISVVIAAAIWLVLVAWLHNTRRPWELIFSDHIDVPVRSYNETVTGRYISGDEDETRLLVEGSPQLVTAVEEGYDSVSRMDSQPSPPSVLDTATAKHPKPLVMYLSQPDRTTSITDPSITDLRMIEQLMQIVDRLACDAELQVTVSNGAHPSRVPLRRQMDTDVTYTDSIFARIGASAKGTVNGHDTDPYWTANVQVIAAPKTVSEHHQAEEVLGSCGFSLPDSPTVETTVEPITPAFNTPMTEPVRFPRLDRVITRISKTLGARPEDQRSTSRGVVDGIRYWIGSWADPQATISRAEAISSRQLRAPRHGNSHFGSEQTDLLVSREALVSLLVARRNKTDQLAAALDDEVQGEAMTRNNKVDYAVSDATQMDSTNPPTTFTDGGMADEDDDQSTLGDDNDTHTSH